MDLSDNDLYNIKDALCSYYLRVCKNLEGSKSNELKHDSLKRYKNSIEVTVIKVKKEMIKRGLEISS